MKYFYFSTNFRTVGRKNAKAETLQEGLMFPEEQHLPLDESKRERRRHIMKLCTWLGTL